MSLPRYPAYKDSGVEWLREVPHHWDIERISRRFRNPRDLILADQLDGLAVFHYSIPVVQEKGDGQVEDGGNIDSSKFEIKQSAILLSKLNPRKGTVCLAQPHAEVTVCSSEFVQLVPENGSLRFGLYLFSSEPMRAYLSSMVESATRSHQRVTPSDVVKVCWAFPSPDEQVSIATFLDRETAKIDALIAEQRRLMELLKEKRQAVISHAVTKGLNPDAPMKGSGVEWLGEVPAHWQVGRCRFYVDVISGFAFPSAGFTDSTDATRLLRGINVGVSRIRWDDTVYWERSEGDNLDAFDLREGDLVIGMDRPLVGEGMRVAKLSAADVPCLLLQRVATLRVRKKMRVDFLQHLLASEMFVAHFAPETTGVSVPHISPDQIAAFIVPVPSTEEQDLITAHLTAACTQLEELHRSSVQAIALLFERRTALISAAVTGNVDVRSLTPALSTA